MLKKKSTPLLDGFVGNRKIILRKHAWAGDAYVEYMMHNDLLMCADLVRHTKFENVVKRLMSLQKEIDAQKKELKSQIENEEHEYIEHQKS